MKVLIIFAVILTGLTAKSQVDSTAQDSMKAMPAPVPYDNERRVHVDINYGHRHDEDSWYDRNESWRKYRRVKTRYFLVDLGFDSYVQTEPYYLDNGLNAFDQDQLKSINANVHIYMQRLHLLGRAVNLLHGLTIEYHQYAFINSVDLQPQRPVLTFLESPFEYKKNELKLSYISLPVMLNFETNPRHFGRSLRLSAGPVAGLRLFSMLKQKGHQVDKVKIRDDFNLNNIKWGGRVQFGFGPINLYATMSLTPIFDPDQDNGSELYPYSIGIQLIPF